MQRRAFLLKMMAGAALLQVARLNPASAQTAAACREDLKGQGIVGSSMGFFEIRHQHAHTVTLTQEQLALLSQGRHLTNHL